MKVLGYNGGLDGYPSKFDTGHDAAAAIVVDGQVVAACEEERFSREKHTAKFPRLAIEYCLREAGLRDASELDAVAYYFSLPLMHHPRKYAENASRVPSLLRPVAWTALHGMRAAHRLAGYDHARSQRVFEQQMKTTLASGTFTAVMHHLAHAASAFYESPFERALCVTLDAEGESASSCVARANDSGIRVIDESYAPNSLGYLYALITRYLGFDKHDEYKVMGLAPYGDPASYARFFDVVVQTGDDGRFSVDPGLILALQAREAFFGDKTWMYPSSMLRKLGPARKPHEPITQRHMDIAAALQSALERAVLHLLTHHRRATGERHLCMAGGVALNCSMNGKIARSGLFDGIWIHPAAHDAGTAVGAALFTERLRTGRKHVPARTHRIDLGPSFDDRAVHDALVRHAGEVHHRRPEDLYDAVAEAIAEGKVVGWYQGRSEWGPRALGYRSILADPRRDDMKDVVNHAVKLREGFRPFAPACLAERANEWFDMTGLDTSPYMLFVVPVRPDKRTRIPAVTHVDGTARVQTVTAAQNAKFHALISAFARRTGVPVVLNTSFNVKGEPIVQTPEDAVLCFLKTKIDLLVLHDVIVEKRPEVARALEQERAASRNTGRVVAGQISMS